MLTRKGISLFQSALKRRSLSQEKTFTFKRSSRLSSKLNVLKITHGRRYLHVEPKTLDERSRPVQTLEESTVSPSDVMPIPTFRILGEDGVLLKTSKNVELKDDVVLNIYQQMIRLSQMDQFLYDIQRQGRISFYMTSFGEEATHFGSSAALDFEDIVYAQYREAGVLMWRGFSYDDFCNQCYSNHLDLGKGRQMPMHYGSNELNFHTISSPLTTQLPQAAGCAYALKMQGKKNVCICYFGEGAASEGDFHAALNFAATLDCPVIYFCRNNKYAISTPAHEQYRGDGIAGRGVSYGIKTIRVDGNDLFAVYEATLEARRYALEHNKPVLIEAMTYRVGHHSTSDDATRYRSQEEIDYWTGDRSPMSRVRKYLEKRGLWDEVKEKEVRSTARKDILEAIKKAEAQVKPSRSELFSDVYDELTPNLKEQKRELEEHLAKYPDAYPLETFKD